jgi:hypothetical protein
MRQPTKLFLIVLLCSVLYSGAMAAAKSLVSDAEVRKTYAESMNVNPETLEPWDSGVAYFAAGVGNRDFVLVLEPPSQTACDAAMDFLAQEQTFLADLESRGFRNVACVREDDGKYVRETRVISRKPPVRPAPRAAPSKHDARTSEAAA